MIMLAGGPLAAAYFISSGCGVRLFLLALRSSGTFDGSYENGSTPLLFIATLGVGWQQRLVLIIMKFTRFLKVLATALLSVAVLSCGKFDDSAIWQAINKQSEEIAALKEQCGKINSDIESLRKIVESIQVGDYITSCTPLSDGSGYTISFKSGTSIVIKNGVDGKDGSTPQIGVEKNSDGLYYWTLNGNWLLDGQGKMVRAEGVNGKDAIAPKLKIENGDWYLSTDNGASWTKIGRAVGADGDSLFKSVTAEEDYVVFVLSDGRELKVPYFNETVIVTCDKYDSSPYTIKLYGMCSLEEENDGFPVEYGFEITDNDFKSYCRNFRTKEKNADNEFCCEITNLNPGEEYYYRSFVLHKGIRTYGEVKVFKTYVTTIAEILEMIQGNSKVTIADEALIRAVVISNISIDNLYSRKALYVQDTTGGLFLYCNEDQSIAFGTEVSIDLSGQTLEYYQGTLGTLEVNDLSLDRIKKIGEVDVQPIAIDAADLVANKYERRYVSIKDVQVAEEDLSKTWVVGNKHTNIKMEAKTGEKFIVRSGRYFTYGSSTVPQGSGTLCGIATCYGSDIQIILTHYSDWSSLVGERFSAGTSSVSDDEVRE